MSLFHKFTTIVIWPIATTLYVFKTGTYLQILNQYRLSWNRSRLPHSITSSEISFSWPPALPYTVSQHPPLSVHPP